MLQLLTAGADPNALGPGPLSLLSALGVSHSKSCSYGAFSCTGAQGAQPPKTAVFSARAVPARLSNGEVSEGTALVQVAASLSGPCGAFERHSRFP